MRQKRNERKEWEERKEDAVLWESPPPPWLIRESIVQHIPNLERLRQEQQRIDSGSHSLATQSNDSDKTARMLDHLNLWSCT
jgi:hypothetical protein